MAVFYLALVALLGGGPATAAPPSDARQGAGDPEALYRERERPAAALEAERLWAARLSVDAEDFDAAWKLARIRYWLGTNGPGDAAAKKRVLEAGVAAARGAAAARPDAPDGHFWLAANMGALADAHGLRQGMRYRTPIREALERARAIAPSYLDGSPDRALGRWYYKVPRLFGGDLAKSESHLRAALGYNPASIISLFFLAETLVALDRRDEARTTLRTLLATPSDPDWMPEDARFRADARALLARLK